MRKIVMFNRVSADGYFADANGGLGWVVPDPELDRAAGEGMPNTDTILFGRRTYEMFESFWPKVAADPASATDPHSGVAPSPGLLAMARFIDAAAKVVFSR